jgi:hypothetical protein
MRSTVSQINKSCCINTLYFFFTYFRAHATSAVDMYIYFTAATGCKVVCRQVASRKRQKILFQGQIPNYVLMSNPFS